MSKRSDYYQLQEIEHPREVTKGANYYNLDEQEIKSRYLSLIPPVKRWVAFPTNTCMPISFSLVVGRCLCFWSCWCWGVVVVVVVVVVFSSDLFEDESNLGRLALSSAMLLLVLLLLLLPSWSIGLFAVSISSLNSLKQQNKITAKKESKKIFEAYDSFWSSSLSLNDGSITREITNTWKVQRENFVY